MKRDRRRSMKNDAYGMNAALQKKYVRIKALLTKSATINTLAMYEVGRLVNEVRNAKRYGDQAVAKLARALDRDVDSLYVYGSVAKTWTESRFKSLVARRSVNGMPLTFSHFVALTKAPQKKRAPLLEETLRNGYSFRQLMDLIASGRGPAFSEVRTGTVRDLTAGRFLEVARTESTVGLLATGALVQLPYWKNKRVRITITAMPAKRGKKRESRG
jgi:hypothetical protein